MGRFIVWILPARKHLAVVNGGSFNSITADEPMVDIDTKTVLVTGVADAILFRPASV
jgi:hypothetical protein